MECHCLDAMNIEPPSKLPGVGTTIFTVMSQLADECNAVNLSQGFPSFDPPSKLIERISYHMHRGANQYAPMTGIPELKGAIADKTISLQGRAVDADSEITVCSGATEGLFCAIQALVHPGDEVIVFDPAYDSYEPAISLAGGHIRHLPLAVCDKGFDFSIDWQRLEDTINLKTRLIILNFPHNPTGSILSSADLQRLAEMLRGSSVYVLSDEVYEHIVFDDRRHRSVLSNPELADRSLAISSFGKTFHATGWKVGYCIAPPRLSAEFRKVHQFVNFTVITPIQHALADFLISDPDFYAQLSAFYQKKRDHFCRLFEGSRFRLQPARSTFFQIVDYSDVCDDDDLKLAKRWTREIGVASIPLSVFCEHPFTGKRLRFCFAKDDATLGEAVGRLRQL